MLGAYVLSSLPGDQMRPLVSTSLMGMGVIVIVKAFRTFPPVSVTRHLAPLGFFGAFVDAVGGGGWGPIVASTLIVRGGDTRTTIGSVSAVEFFVTVAASVTFILTIGVTYWQAVVGLAIGGAVAAPIGAYACQHLPLRPLMFLVGTLIVLLSLNVLLRL